MARCLAGFWLVGGCLAGWSLACGLLWLGRRLLFRLVAWGGWLLGRWALDLVGLRLVVR